MSGATREDAGRLLSEFQRRAWEENPPPPGSALAQAAETRRVLRDRIATDPSYADEFRARLREASPSESAMTEAFIQAGEHEDPWAYRVVTSAVADVERALGELGRRVPGPVAVGTARTRRVNAIVIALGPDADSGRVVVIDGGLLPFLADIALLVVRSAPAAPAEDATGFSLDPDVVRAHLAEDPALVQRTADDVERFVMGSYPLEPLLTEDSLAGDHRSFWNALYRLLVVFVVGHEYAHLHLGHLGRPSPGSPDVQGVGSAEIAHDWMLESEADGGGVEVTLRVGQRYAIEPSVAYLACELFFVGAQIIELGEGIRATGSRERALDEIIGVEQLALEQPAEAARFRSHPPPGLRRKALRVILQNSATPERFESLTAGARSFDQAYAEILAPLSVALERRLVGV